MKFFSGPGMVLAIIAIVILLCAAAGCAGNGSGIPAPTSRVSGVWSEDNFPKNVYFSYNCKGTWTSHSVSPENEAGTFTVTGNVPFRIFYYWDNPAHVADYNALLANGNKPDLFLNSEYSACVDTPDSQKCQPCHFVYQGKISTFGFLLYNGSADAGNRWTAAFHSLGASTLSITQTDASCPESFVTAVEGNPGPYLTHKAEDLCFTNTVDPNDAGSVATPFAFTDGSAIRVHVPEQQDYYVLTDYDPAVLFQIGASPDESPNPTLPLTTATTEEPVSLAPLVPVTEEPVTLGVLVPVGGS